MGEERVQHQDYPTGGEGSNGVEPQLPRTPGEEMGTSHQRVFKAGLSSPPQCPGRCLARGGEGVFSSWRIWMVLEPGFSAFGKPQRDAPQGGSL